VLGGTGGNLGMMDIGTRELIDEQIEGHQIERNRLDELFESSAPLSPQERVDRFGLPRKRADILVAGLVILYGVLDRLGLRRVRASRHSLRHGVLRSLWNAR
jgi:exopolyphosphatase/pppGpp-phosphohydrolase